MVQSLTELNAVLKKTLGDVAVFALVNTRVILRTGVDLNGIQKDQDTNPETINKVLKALTAMGYSTASLLTIAERRRNS